MREFLHAGIFSVLSNLFCFLIPLLLFPVSRMNAVMLEVCTSEAEEDEFECERANAEQQELWTCTE